MLKRQQEIMKEAEERRLFRERDQYLQQHLQEQMKRTEYESQVSIEEPSVTYLKEQTMPNEATIFQSEFLKDTSTSVKPPSPHAKQIPVKVPQTFHQEKHIESAQRKGNKLALLVRSTPGLRGVQLIFLLLVF